MTQILSTPIGAASAGPSRDVRLREAARQLEANFLTVMLKSAGYGESRTSMGGGLGEDQFTSFLQRAQAENMVMAGGIGLAEHLYESLKGGPDGA